MANKANSIDWQLACKDVKTRNNYILENDIWTDCSFFIGTETEHVVVRAHKLILAAASPVFEAMLYGLLAQGNEPILVKDIKLDTFRNILKYLYTDNIEFTEETAYEIYYVAQKYMLAELRNKCSDYLIKSINIFNACHTLELSKLFNDQKVKELSLEFISSNTFAILKNIKYDDISIKTLEEIFSLEKLNISSELELYAAAERYAETQLAIKDLGHILTDFKMDTSMGSTNETETSESYGKVNESDQCSAKENTKLLLAEIRSTVRPLLQKIRFLTLSAQEFSRYDSIRSLLTDDEILALLMNILNSTCFPFPKGFSTAMLSRKHFCNKLNYAPKSQGYSPTSSVYSFNSPKVLQIFSYYDSTYTSPNSASPSYSDSDIPL